MFNIRINSESCNGCGTCVKVCPYICFQLVDRSGKVKSQKHSELIKDPPESCVGCRSCQIRCLNFAIDILEENSASL